MNTRWKSLFLAVFSACLLAGSVNARVCFLADGKCNDMQLRPVAVGEDCKYSVQSCVSPKKVSEEWCEKNGIRYYKECVCNESFKYKKDASDNMYDYTNGSKRPIVRACDGKYKYKVCKEKYLYVVEDADNVNDRLDADIYHPVANCSGGSSVDLDSDSCEEIDLGIIRYSGCGCNRADYPYTEEDIKGYEGLVSLAGDTCVVDGVIHYKNLTCTGGSGNGFYYKSQCADNEDEHSAHNISIGGKTICWACKSKYTCNNANGEYAKVEDCTGSMPYAVCTLDSNGCWQVTGCENTSLGYGQTLVASKKACYDTNNDGCNDNDDNCMEDCNCISDTCEINYVLGEQSRTCEPQFDCETLGYKYCNSNFGEVGTTRGEYYCTTNSGVKQYFENCEVNTLLCRVINRDDEVNYNEAVGTCEIVLPPKESDKWSVQNGLVNAEDEGYWKRQRYSKEYAEYWLNNGYYYVRPCQILVAEDNSLKVRLHDCMSEERDCDGSFSIVYDSTPDNEENDFPGWKTADVDDDTMANGKRCLNPTQNGEQIVVGATPDGTRVECGGKEYITDCKCTTFNAGKPEGCEIRILEAPLSKYGIVIPTLKIEAGDVVHCNNETGKCGSDETGDLQVFTGELVPGCANAQDGPAFKLVYAYFRDPDSNKKCLSSAPIDEMTDFCTGEEVCVGTVLSESEAGIRCAGKCGTEGNCDKGYVCTEYTRYDEKTNICTGECVPEKCPLGQVCTEAITIDDVGGIRKYCKQESCITPKPACTNKAYYCDEVIDPMTNTKYCVSDCKNGCQEYVEDLKRDGKNVEYISNISSTPQCMISTENGGWVDQTRKLITLDNDVQCYISQDCGRPIDPNSPCADYFTEQELPPPGYKECGYFTPCVKSATCYSECHTDYYFSSGDCCKGKSGGEIIYTNKASFEDDITRGFIDTTSEHYPNYKDDETFDEQIGCYYTKCEGIEVSSDYKKYCCPKAKEGHILVSSIDDRFDTDVTSEYGEVFEACHYAKIQEVECEDYSKFYKEAYPSACIEYFTQGQEDKDNYFYLFSNNEVRMASIKAYNCSAYAKCTLNSCNGKTSPIKGAKTAEELCGEGKVPDSSGLIPECGGKYYKADTRCVCPDKESYGLYLDKADDDGYYYEGDAGIAGCKYYKKCTKPDGYVTKAECENKGKVVPTGAASILQCNTTYYQGECVCPDLSDQGCYFEGTSDKVTYEVTGTIPNVSSECKYVAHCYSNLKNCAGAYSPIADLNTTSREECEEKGGYVDEETLVEATKDGICGGPLYETCYVQTQ